MHSHTQSHTRHTQATTSLRVEDHREDDRPRKGDKVDEHALEVCGNELLAQDGRREPQVVGVELGAPDRVVVHQGREGARMKRQRELILFGAARQRARFAEEALRAGLRILNRGAEDEAALEDDGEEDEDADVEDDTRIGGRAVCGTSGY